MLSFGIEEEALCLKDHKKQQDFDKIDKYEIWKNRPGPKLSTLSRCCLVVVD
jgi:uncharacterized membrane protein